MRAPVLALIAIAAVAACGGPADSSPPEATTFAEVRDDILLKSCGIATCHKPNADPTKWASESELVFDPADPDAVYDAIVNATAASGKTLIVPNDPDGSFLIVKAQGAQGTDEGDEMPPNGFGLDADSIAMIVSWVEDGAANN